MKYDIKSLTLDEKLQLLTGRDNWRLSNANGKLPDVFLSDGPNGLRMHDMNDPHHATKKATAMPNISLIANSWNEEIAFLDGATIADECIENGADVLLAPGVNIKRTPLCGRNFEYFSEDPLLAGNLAKAYVEGVQSKGVGTSLKHYCANNREHDRFFQTSEIDERTLREIYLPAFEIAVKAQPWTVMCSYNPVNGVWASENEWLLKDILREEFGFDGVIVSDWGAVHNSWRAAKATLDLEMPYRAQAFSELKAAYEKGLLTEEEIDARVTKILELMEKVVTVEKKITTKKTERHEIAVKIAREGIVLLKNEDGILPLKPCKIVTTGDFALKTAYGGGGSAFVQSEYRQKPLHEELQVRLGENSDCFYVSWSGGGASQGAYRSDVAIICVGTQGECEGSDRSTLRLHETHETFILDTAKYNKNTIVVLNAGAAVDMTAWIDKVKAVVLLGFAGEGGMEALADILTGKVCPSGKLSETFPLSVEDTPTGTKRGNGSVERYAEGVFVGYRWYDSLQKEVLFPFGHGLSYAAFEYSDLKIEKFGETDYEVSYTVKNVSDVDGKEVSQVYIRDVFAKVSRPDKELKGYAKTTLKAGESKRVSVKLDYRSFAFYSIPLKKWQVENGEFEILVGASSRDIRLMKKIVVELPEKEQYTLPNV